jgi:RNA polymerase sigma factor (sigma-70 family)
MSETDLQLLARYLKAGAEDAFAELVHRHLNLVYSAALRQVRSPQLAEEVAQAVFVDLSRNARQLRPDTIVTAWLYAVTRRTAIDVVRRESRRQLREQIAIEMNAINATTGDWTQIEPLLDEAVSALDDTDRAAVLLRYFENKSLREVGAALGASDDAAQKRVSRAIERLREFFAKRGVTVGASGLALVLSANAVQAAPTGLGAALIGVSLATAGTGSAFTLLNLMIMTKFKAAILSALVVAGGAATVAIQYQARARLRGENESLRHQVAQLQLEKEQLSNSVAGASIRSLPDDQYHELLRLRGEVGSLRQQNQESAKPRETANLTEAQKAALAKLRTSTSLGDALQALDALRSLAPAPEVLSELARIAKENPRAAQALRYGDVIAHLAGGADEKVDAAFRPLIRDQDPSVRETAAYVLAFVLKSQAGLDVINVAVDQLKSSDENARVGAISTLSNAGQDPNDRRLRVTTASLGTAAGDATAALLDIAQHCRREDLRESAMRLLIGLDPDLSQVDPALQASFKENLAMNAAIERLNMRPAKLPEILEDLKRFPGAIPTAADALASLGPEAQSALPALQEALATLAPNPEASAPDRQAAFRARERLVNAMHSIAPDQPKPLFTESDMRSVMQILHDPKIRADAERNQKVSTAVRPVLAGAPGNGVELTPEQMSRLLEALKEADLPTYTAIAAEVKKIDPHFSAGPRP